VLNDRLLAEFKDADYEDAKFSPDSGALITTNSGEPYVWDARTGKFIGKLTDVGGKEDKRQKWISAERFSPDGKLVLTSESFSENSEVQYKLCVWDVVTASYVRCSDFGKEQFAVFSQDSKYLATWSWGSGATVSVWETRKAGKVVPVKDVDGKDPEDFGVETTFSPDSRFILTADRDKVRIWDALQGRLVALLEGHGNNVTGGAFSPNSEFIVTWSTDRTIRIWDARTSKTIFVLENQEDLEDVAFNPDGKSIVTTNRKGAEFIYRCDVCASLDDLLGLTRRRLSLTNSKLLAK
jgi:WD40 repeat protein